jgi:hypothetical protein
VYESVELLIEQHLQRVCRSALQCRRSDVLFAILAGTETTVLCCVFMRGLCAVMALVVLGCSSTVVERGGTSAACQKGTNCKGGGSGVVHDSNGSGGGSSTGTDGGFQVGSGGARGVCGGQTFEPEPAPVDMYIMFGQSSSMADPIPSSNPSISWWQAAQQGVTDFVNDPRAAGLQVDLPVTAVGIQFFPLNGVAPQSCTADYKTPEVEIGLLPGNAKAVAGAILKHQPTAFTPTAPALQGAINHMKEWSPNHPGRAPVVVLVTNGFPTECDPQDIIDIASIAQNALNTVPSVRTFVVGFNLGPGGSNLDALAEAGGTGKPFLIDEGDIGAQFVDAMLSISNATRQCMFDVPTPPTGTTLDAGTLGVTYTPSATGVEAQVPKLNGLGDCDLNMGTGWFFDSPTAPSKILLCPGTCAKLAAGVAKVVTGCLPLAGITR